MMYTEEVSKGLGTLGGLSKYQHLNPEFMRIWKNLYVNMKFKQLTLKYTVSHI